MRTRRFEDKEDVAERLAQVVGVNNDEVLVHQALNPDPHKLVLSLLLGVGKILPDDECRDINALCLGITPVFPPSCLPKPRRRLGSEEK